MATAKTATLTFRIDPSLKAAVRVAAQQEHRSAADMLEVLIRDYCGRNGIEISEQNILSHNEVSEPSEDIESELHLEQFPPPSILWHCYMKWRGINESAESLVVQSYQEDISRKEPRYYQVEAINRTVEAIAGGKRPVCPSRAYSI